MIETERQSDGCIQTETYGDRERATDRERRAYPLWGLWAEKERTRERVRERENERENERG